MLHANRVLACSAAARAEGVRRGLRKREAQSRCPQLIVVDHDPGRDARAFEPVVAAVEEVAAGVEVIRPGACALAARGPARYFGGEEQAAERIVEQVAQSCGVESQVGIADGVFAAGLAARAGRIVAAGRTPEFLAGLPVEALDRPPLTDLLRRLGLRTLGDFAALPAGDVLARFGFDAALAHRLAAGPRPPAARRPPAAARPGRDRRPTTSRSTGSTRPRSPPGRSPNGCTSGSPGTAWPAPGWASRRSPPHGQELHRVWRHDGLLTAAAIADRVRWQLDGWLTGSQPRRRRGRRPTAGIVRLRLIPDGVLAHAGLQPGLWGETGRGAGAGAPGAEPGAGPARPGGGGHRGARRRARPRPTRCGWCRGATSALPGPAAGRRPWPGRLPPPAPAAGAARAAAARRCCDAAGEPVGVSARLEVSAAAGPARRRHGAAPVGDRRLGRAVAGRRALVGAGRGPPAGPVPGRPRRRPGAAALPWPSGRWAVEAIYD